MKLYTSSAIDAAIVTLDESGYECCQIDEGSLGCGTWICIPPEKETMYYYVFWEVAINEWSSAHRMRKCKKLTKEHQKWLDEYYERTEI